MHSPQYHLLRNVERPSVAYWSTMRSAQLRWFNCTAWAIVLIIHQGHGTREMAHVASTGTCNTRTMPVVTAKRTAVE